MDHAEGGTRFGPAVTGGSVAVVSGGNTSWGGAREAVGSRGAAKTVAAMEEKIEVRGAFPGEGGREGGLSRCALRLLSGPHHKREDAFLLLAGCEEYNNVAKSRGDIFINLRRWRRRACLSAGF